jgi:hypothetical protein
LHAHNRSTRIYDPFGSSDARPPFTRRLFVTPGLF